MDWFYKEGGAARFWPEAWKAFKNMVPKNEQNNKIYNEGFDFVIGRSKVLNSDSIFALYQSCYENHNYNKKNFKPKWSEGFSVKKKCIEDVGLYEDIGINGGNDNMLSEKLERKYKVKRDFNLIMHHRAPDNFKELFDQQIQRGSAGPQFDLLFLKKSKIFIFSKYLTKFSINLFNILVHLKDSTLMLLVTAMQWPKTPLL